MSSPDTNISKQTRRHRPALYGIAIAIIITVPVVFFTNVLTPGAAVEDSAPPASTEGSD